MRKYKHKDEIRVGDKVRFIKALSYNNWYDTNTQEIIGKYDFLIVVTTKDCGMKKFNGDSHNSIILYYDNVRKLSISELREIALVKLFN